MFTVESWMLLALCFLFIKHWYIDFVNQTMDEVHGKGIYGNRIGMWHSGKQGLGTVVVFLLVGDSIVGAAFLGLIDFFIHYHTDWAKININKRFNYTIENPKFWMWLGADQLVHSLTYLFLVYLVVL